MARTVKRKVVFITSLSPPDPISGAATSRFYSWGGRGTTTIRVSGKINVSPELSLAFSTPEHAFSVEHSVSLFRVSLPSVLVLSRALVVLNRMCFPIFDPREIEVF